MNDRRRFLRLKLTEGQNHNGGSAAEMLDKAKAAEVFRTLVDQVMMVPDNGELAIILRGDLAAILRFVAGKKNPDILTEAGVMAKLLSQGSMVAGIGFEPMTFRL